MREGEKAARFLPFRINAFRQLSEAKQKTTRYAGGRQRVIAEVRSSLLRRPADCVDALARRFNA